MRTAAPDHVVVDQVDELIGTAVNKRGDCLFQCSLIVRIHEASIAIETQLVKANPWLRTWLAATAAPFPASLVELHGSSQDQ